MLFQDLLLDVLCLSLGVHQGSVLKCFVFTMYTQQLSITAGQY